MQNVSIKRLFYNLFIQTKKNEQTKHICCLNSLKALIYLLGRETANHVRYMQTVLVSYSSIYTHAEKRRPLQFTPFVEIK